MVDLSRLKPESRKILENILDVGEALKPAPAPPAYKLAHREPTADATREVFALHAFLGLEGANIETPPGARLFLDEARFAELHAAGSIIAADDPLADETLRYLRRTIARPLDIADAPATSPAVEHARAQAAADAARDGRTSRMAQFQRGE